MPKYKEVKEEKTAKFQRVLGQKLDIEKDCKLYQEKPELRLKLLNYEIVELPENTKLRGVKVISEIENTKKVEE